MFCPSVYVHFCTSCHALSLLQLPLRLFPIQLLPPWAPWPWGWFACFTCAAWCCPPPEWISRQQKHDASCGILAQLEAEIIGPPTGLVALLAPEDRGSLASCGWKAFTLQPWLAVTSKILTRFFWMPDTSRIDESDWNARTEKPGKQVSWNQSWTNRSNQPQTSLVQCQRVVLFPCRALCP